MTSDAEASTTKKYKYIYYMYLLEGGRALFLNLPPSDNKKKTAKHTKENLLVLKTIFIIKLT